MKKIILVVSILFSTAAFPLLTPPLSATEVWSINTGLNYTTGLFFNRGWDPGYNGTAMSVLLELQKDDFLIEAGVEAGYNYTGLNLLFPLKGGWIFSQSDTLSFSANAALMPGMILSRPLPYFLIAAEITAGLRWAVTPGFNISLSAGPRYTTSPEYSSVVAPLEFIDLPVKLEAGFILGD